MGRIYILLRWLKRQGRIHWWIFPEISVYSAIVFRKRCWESRRLCSQEQNRAAPRPLRTMAQLRTPGGCKACQFKIYLASLNSAAHLKAELTWIICVQLSHVNRYGMRTKYCFPDFQGERFQSEHSDLRVTHNHSEWGEGGNIWIKLFESWEFGL